MRHALAADADLNKEVLALAELVGAVGATDEETINNLIARMPDRVDTMLLSSQEARDLKISLGLGLAGSLDPTPTLDAIGAVHSLNMAATYGNLDYTLDVAVFVLGAIVPYAGDAASKTALGARATARLAQLAKTTARLRDLLLRRTLLLGRTAWAAENQRGGRAFEFFLRFKNDPAFAGWVERNLATIDPAQQDMEMLADAFLKNYKGASIPRPPASVDLGHAKLKGGSVGGPDIAQQRHFGGVASKHEVRLLALRRGDRVKVTSAYSGKSREITLGEFVGSGNATHLYAVAENPNQVLGLPFVAENVYRDWKGRGWSGPKQAVEGARRYLARKVLQRHWFKGLEKSKAMAIVDHGEGGEYYVAELINVVEKGNHLIRRLERAPGGGTDRDIERLLDLQAAIAEVEKRRELGYSGAIYNQLGSSGRRAIGRDSRLRGMTDDGPTSTPVTADQARQFAWDGRQWVLLDWE